MLELRVARRYHGEIKGLDWLLTNFPQVTSHDLLFHPGQQVSGIHNRIFARSMTCTTFNSLHAIVERPNPLSSISEDGIKYPPN